MSEEQDREQDEAILSQMAHLVKKNTTMSVTIAIPRAFSCHCSTSIATSVFQTIPFHSIQSPQRTAIAMVTERVRQRMQSKSR